MNSLCPTYFNSCFRELFNEKKPFNIIIRGHLYCESAIERLIQCQADNIDKLEFDKITFFNKLRIATCFAAIPPDLFSVLDRLTYYRNQFAHNLSYTFEEKDQVDLANTLKGEIEEDHLKKALCAYINGDKAFPGQLRRIVLSVWLLLEIDYLLKTQGLKSGVTISEIIAPSDLEDNLGMKQSLLETRNLLIKLFPDTFRNIS